MSFFLLAHLGALAHLAQIRVAPGGFEIGAPWLSCSPMSSQPSGNDPLQQIQDIAIERKPFEGEVYDVMGGSARWEVKVHEHGLVALVDVMPRFAPAGKTADFAIVQAARVSLRRGHQAGERGPRPDPLPRPPPPHDAVRDGGVQVPPRHADLRRPPVDPPPHGERERVHGPLLGRAATASTGRASRTSASKARATGRAARSRSTTRRPSSSSSYLDAIEEQHKRYEELLAKGVARELARIALPVERLHRVVLEDRPAQPAALPVAADGPARPAGDPRLRQRDVRPDPARSSRSPPRRSSTTTSQSMHLTAPGDRSDPLRQAARDRKQARERPSGRKRRSDSGCKVNAEW